MCSVLIYLDVCSDLVRGDACSIWLPTMRSEIFISFFVDCRGGMDVFWLSVISLSSLDFVSDGRNSIVTTTS